MKRSAWLWIIALLVTVASARWQRMTGPTHELPGDASLGGTSIHYVLQRTHKGEGGQRVEIAKVPAGVTGVTEWKAYGSRDPWTVSPMERRGDVLAAELPHLPPAGKLWYRVRLASGAQSVIIPADRPAAIRYTGPVPAGILVPHIFLMFLAMLLSTRAGLEIFSREPRLKGLTYGTLAAVFVGGMVIGPFVTHYAFGEWWTGFPVGSDITDSKTLIAVVAWIAAAVAVGRSRMEKAWVVLAALVTIGVFAIPHSWTASEPLHSALDTGAASTAPAVPPSAVPDTVPPAR